MLGNGIRAILPFRATYPLWPSSNTTAIGHRICAQDLVNKRVDCSSRRLTEVPHDLYSDVHRLNLELNNLTSLRNVSFQFYIQLEDIMIGSANIHYIESGTFRPLKNLKYLNLWNNPGLFFPVNVVQWSSELKLLNISACGLNLFDFRVLKFLPKLEELDLTFNEITSISGASQNIELIIDLIPSIVTEHAQARFLDGKFAANIILQDNPIQVVDPGTVAGLPGRMLALEGHPLSRELIRNISIGIAKGRIDSLTMKSSGIRNITTDMFEPLRNTSLVYLGLLGNRLVLYPFVFANLRLLFELDLTGCGLTSLEPEYFYGMSSLRKISLSDNHFSSLNPYNATWVINVSEMFLIVSYGEEVNKHTFKGLHNLTKLLLRYEAEYFVSTVEIDLPTLENLTVMCNRIDGIMLKTPQLRYFEAKRSDTTKTSYLTEYNFRNSVRLIEHIKIVDGALWGYKPNIDRRLESMKNLHNLRVLDLSVNNIHELESGPFRNISSLQSLNLSFNLISTIYPDTFSELNSLTMLNLEGNFITSLPKNFLTGMKVLTSLHLRFNRLGYLDEDLFADTKMLATLTLSSNRFVGFNKTTFEPIYSSLISVDISRNVLVCTCESSWIVEYLGNSLTNEHRTICSTSSDTLEPLRGKPISFLKPGEYCGVNITLMCSLISTGIAMLSITVICYKHRCILKYKLYLLKLVILGYGKIQNECNREDFEYDINIMFMDEDRDFAKEIFRPALTEMLPRRGIAFGDDALLLGMYYFDAVYYNVEKSFKTILLISRAAVQEDTFMTKFRIAMNHVTDTQTQNLILISLEDIPDEEFPYLLRLYLSGQGPYLRWQENENGQVYFWKMLAIHLTGNIRGGKVSHVIYPF